MHTLIRGLMFAGTATIALTMASSAMAQTTLNFLAAETEERFAPVIAAFETANPDIDVVYQSVPFDELNTAIETRVGRGDTSIDVYAADTPRIPAFASRGYMLNLDEARERISEAVPNAVDLELVSHEGAVFGYPMWTSSQLLYFNRDLLSQAGVEEPSSSVSTPDTWEIIVANATAAKEAGAPWGLMFQQVDRYYQLQPLFESSGAGNGLTGDDLLTPALDSDAWKQTATWYAEVFADELGPRGISPNQTDDLFARGEVAYYVGGPWAIPMFENTEGLNYGVAAHPYFEGGEQVTPTGAWALAINPASNNIDAAKKFAEYVTLSTEGATLATSLVPVNAGAFQAYGATLEALTPKIGPVLTILADQAANSAITRPRTVGYVAFETEMNRVFADIRNGSDVSGTLDDAQQRMGGILARQR